MYDVAIIGGGPAGYLAAERLGKLGKKVLLIEKGHLGGTCLNVGCIPTKTLLASAKQYVHAKEAARFGVHASQVSFDLEEMQAWKEEVVTGLRSGIAAQMKRHSVDVVSGSGSIIARDRVKAIPDSIEDPPIEFACRSILIATGSSPLLPPIHGTKDNPRLVDSTGLLECREVPRKLCVIGGGVIGVEFASLFASLGSSVTVIEMMDEIVPFMDREQAPLLRKALTDVDFKLGCKVSGLEGGLVSYTTREGLPEIIDADLVLMAVGRRPNVAGWGAEVLGLDIGAKGIATDNRQRTSVSGVWAAGDVTGKSQLAHSAYRMAEVAVADIVAFLDGTAPVANILRLDAIPWAVYSIPEASGVGLTEQEAASRGVAIKTATVPMKYSGRFVAENGFKGAGEVKLIAAADGGRILGVHAVGAYASEFIWGGAALIEQELRVEDVRQLVFPHPSVAELIREAAWAL